MRIDEALKIMFNEGLAIRLSTWPKGDYLARDSGGLLINNKGEEVSLTVVNRNLIDWELYTIDGKTDREYVDTSDVWSPASGEWTEVEAEEAEVFITPSKDPQEPVYVNAAIAKRIVQGGGRIKQVSDPEGCYLYMRNGTLCDQNDTMLPIKFIALAADEWEVVDG